MSRLVFARPSSSPPPGNPLFFDDFNYTVARLSSDKEAEFLTGGGYPGMRDSTISGWPTGSWIYTADTITGDSSGIPGGGRALALESLGGTLAQQTDYYLAFPVDDWPADLWIQFWIYVQDDAGSSRQSEVAGGRTKFGYPLLGGDPNYSLQTELTVWILTLTGQVINVAHDDFVAQPSPAHFSFNITPQPGATGGVPTPRAEIVGASDGSNILDPNMVGDSVFLAPNTWHLVKFRFKHDGAVDTNTSEYHFWARQKGQHVAGFTKMSEYVGGQSNPKGDFNFFNRSFDGNPSGDPGTDSADITAFIFPSTANSPAGPWGDLYIYIKDFAVAAADADLPTYGSY